MELHSARRVFQIAKRNPTMKFFTRQLAAFSLFAVCLLVSISAQPCSAQQYRWRRAYFPQNNSDSWSAVAFNPLSHGRIIFAGPLFVGGVFRSDDGGNTWTEHAALLDPDGIPIDEVHQIFCLPSDTNIVFAITPSVFYRSTDGGITWDDRFNHDSLGGLFHNFGGIDAEGLGYNAADNTIYYGEPETGLMRSADSGADWTQVDFASDAIRFFSMDVSQDSPPSIIESSEVDGSFAYSTNQGNSWSVSFRTNEYFESPKIVFSWQALDTATGKHSVAIAQRWDPVESRADSSFLATTDGGATWQILPNPPALTWGIDIDQRASMLSKPGDAAYPRPLHFFTGLFDADQDTVPNGMVQETTDGGISWHSINFPKGIRGDTASPYVREVWVIKYDTTSGRLAVASDSGIYIGDQSDGVTAPPQAGPPIQLTQRANFITLTSQMPIESIHIFDIAGREILESAPMRDVFRINTTQYLSGVYAIEAFIEGQPPFRKIVEW
jgi:hypothetical protein